MHAHKCALLHGCIGRATESELLLPTPFISVYIIYNLFIFIYYIHINMRGDLGQVRPIRGRLNAKKSPPDTASSTVQMFELGSARLTSALFAAKKSTQMTS